jgi:hypothetical protein
VRPILDRDSTPAPKCLRDIQEMTNVSFLFHFLVKKQPSNIPSVHDNSLQRSRADLGAFLSTE